MNIRNAKILLLAAVIGLIPHTPARAGVASSAAREAAEYVLKKFGRNVLKEGAETFAEKLAASAARHGDDVIRAARRVGPSALKMADEAGEQAPTVFRLLSRHGDDAARWVVRRPGAMKLLSRYGDDAAEVLVKHKGLAEPLLENIGEPAVKALGAIGPQGGRRLAMIAEGGELAAMGHTPELMQVITKHGDAAMDFVWRHKGSLAVGAGMTTFLANPEAYINGTNELASTVGTVAVKPLVEGAGQAVSGLIWAVVVLVVGFPAAGIWLAVKQPKLAAEMVRGAVAMGAKGRR